MEFGSFEKGKDDEYSGVSFVETSDIFAMQKDLFSFGRIVF